MQINNQNPQEVVERGVRLYEEAIRSHVETSNLGKFLVINTETGEYEMDADDVTAVKRAKLRFPTAPLFSMRVGYPAVYRLGSRQIVTKA